MFARDLLGVGATGQGGLLTAMGLGALCSAVLLASLGDRLPRGLCMLGGVTGYGLSVVAAASPSFRLSLVLMTLVGLAHVSSHALVQTVVQTYSPSAFRGCTMALFQMSTVVLDPGQHAGRDAGGTCRGPVGGGGDGREQRLAHGYDRSRAASPGRGGWRVPRAQMIHGERHTRHAFLCWPQARIAIESRQ